MEPARAQSVPFPYRGRVRTGCLTCRARKVKCDEARPFCKNCSKKGRDCVWKPRKTHFATQNSTPLSTEVGAVLEETTYPTPASDRPSSSQEQWVPRSPGKSGPADSATKRWNDALQTRDEIFFASEVHDVHMSLPSAFISRDINLTTTMDILTAHESPHQTWLPFFLDSVQCPWITPYDAINWQRAKAKIVKLCVTESRIQPALTALCAVYKAQLYNLPVSTALSLFQAAKDVYGMLLSDDTLNIDAVVVATFLLCLFEVIQYQTVPILRDPDHKLLVILEARTLSESVYSTLALRIITWLIILHIAATRGGGEGIMSNGLYSYLQGTQDRVLGFGTIEVEAPRPHEQILTTLASPLFEFYFRLQQFSGELAHLTHYHRSRSSHQDQEEVVVLMDQIKGRLRKLWDNRPSTLSQIPTDIRNFLAPQIADPIISLMGVCTAAYHAEFVEMDRIMGDPVSRCSDARLSMSCIREIVDGDWNAYSKGSLNPAYLRPIFLCAIECMDAEENQWAVEKLRHIHDPICRSNFFASFGEALLKAELEKGRRVTSKYFCISHFGVSPPYL